MRLRKVFLLCCGILCACDDGATDEGDDGVGPSKPRDAGAEQSPDAGDASLRAVCSPIREALKFPARYDREGFFSSVLDENVLHVAFVKSGCGTSAVERGLSYVTLRSDGTAEMPVDLLSDVNECVGVRSPALGLSGTTPTVFYVAGTETAPDIFVKSVASPGTLASRLVADPDHREGSLHARLVQGETLLAWEGRGAMADSLFTRRADVGGLSPEEVVRAETPASIVSSTLMNVSAAAFSAVAGYAAFGGESAGIFVRPLLAAGKPTAAPISISSAVGEHSRVVVSRAAEGELAAVFSPGYSGKHELRLVPLDESLSPMGRVAIIDASPTNVTEFAVTPFVTGFAVAYRAVHSEGLVIRLAVIDQVGNVAGIVDVAPVTAAAGGLELHAATDGRLFLVWGDTSGATDAGVEQASLHAASLDCFP